MNQSTHTATRWIQTKRVLLPTGTSLCTFDVTCFEKLTWMTWQHVMTAGRRSRAVGDLVTLTHGNGRAGIEGSNPRRVALRTLHVHVMVGRMSELAGIPGRI